MEAALSFLAKGFLLLSHGAILVPLLLGGFISQGGFFITSPSRKGMTDWGKVIVLVLFTMIFNGFLKSIFLVPLNPALGIQGYAFPSGHMQVATVCYGFLFQLYSQTRFWIIFPLIIGGIGFGLIHEGYHNLTDVGGALVFGVASLIAFARLSSISCIRKDPHRISFFLIPLTGFMILGVIFRTGLYAYLGKIWLGLIGFSLFWQTFNRIVKNKKNQDSPEQFP